MFSDAFNFYFQDIEEQKSMISEVEADITYTLNLNSDEEFHVLSIAVNHKSRSRKSYQAFITFFLLQTFSGVRMLKYLEQKISDISHLSPTQTWGFLSIKNISLNIQILQPIRRKY